MEAYYQRYISGDCVGVWQELVLHGSAVRLPPLLAEATSVCHELVERSYGNLVKLHARLTDFGYQFLTPHDSLREPSPQEKAMVDQIEETDGVMPLVVRAWYERIGCVDFSQDQAQLFCKEAVGGKPDPVAGLGLYQHLTFLGLRECLELREQLIRQDGEDQRDTAQSLHFLPTGGYASNCDPKGFCLPIPEIDGIFFNDGGGDVRFVDDLRTGFAWGGFPFWSIMLQHPKKCPPLKVKPDFARLLPVLIEGLSQV